MKREWDVLDNVSFGEREAASRTSVGTPYLSRSVIALFKQSHGAVDDGKR
jgi:hypothetical protein